MNSTQPNPHKKPLSYSALKGRKFLRQTPDCTSTEEEVVNIYAARRDWTGQPAADGHVLDHAHCGPAIGLVPMLMNNVFTTWALEHWDEILAYKVFRDEVVDLSAGRIAWG